MKTRGKAGIQQKFLHADIWLETDILEGGLKNKKKKKKKAINWKDVHEVIWMVTGFFFFFFLSFTACWGHKHCSTCVWDLSPELHQTKSELVFNSVPGEIIISV